MQKTKNGRSLFRFLFILTPTFCLLYTLSQKKEVDLFHQLVAENKVADSLYNAATAMGNSKNYDETKEAELNRKAIEIYNDVFKKAPAEKEFDSIRFYSAFRIGELEHYFENFSEALKGYAYAISVQLKSQLPDSLLFKPYLYSGILCYNQNKFDSASLFFKKAEGIQAAYDYRLQERERLFNTLDRKSVV